MISCLTSAKDLAIYHKDRLNKMIKTIPQAKGEVKDHKTLFLLAPLMLAIIFD